jgi:hypothetical protein
MCFSPQASFIAATLLTVIGVATLKKVKKKHELLFGAIPFFFAIQQFTEGLLWLALMKGGYPVEQHWLTIAFISFAGILWPLLLPVSLFVMETNGHRKRIIAIFFLSGLAIAIITFKAILNFGVSSEIVHSCIRYDSPLKRSYYVTLFYVVATCGPLLYSSYSNIIRIGVINIFAFAIAYYFYEYTYASVWCFFASAISALVYLHFAQDSKKNRSDLLARIAKYI